jgi:hypothetical protein
MWGTQDARASRIALCVNARIIVLRAPPLSERFRQFWLRLNQNSGPANLLEVPCRRVGSWIIRTDFDEISGPAAKQLADQTRFVIGWQDGAHRPSS